MIWTCGSSPRSGSQNAWTRMKNVNGVSRLNKFRNFFGAIQMISCRDWWPWTKPGYIIITRRESKNQWSGGIAAHPVLNNSECKNSLEKFSPCCFGIKTASSSLIIFRRAKVSTRSITCLCWCNWGHFEGKTPREVHQGGVLFLHFFTGPLQPRRNWHTWASNVLITHPILRIWSRRTTTCVPGLKKKIEISPFFIRRGGHWCRGDLVGRTIFWIFMSDLQKLEWRAKKCL